jgi:hypothetical protein
LKRASAVLSAVHFPETYITELKAEVEKALQ